MGWGKTGPTVPMAGTAHQTHPVMTHGPNKNVAVRHPALPGPSMMAPKNDFAELPSGAPTSTPGGGIIGGLAPFQNAKGATNADFQTGPQLKN